MVSKSCKRKIKHLIFFALISTSISVSAQTLKDTSYLRTPLPPVWHYISDYSQPSPDTDNWWRALGDTMLNSLMTRAVEGNFNVAAAVKRIKLAENQCKQIKAGYWPTLGANASWSASGGSGRRGPEKAMASSDRFFSLGLSAAWEIDVFGRISQKLKAGKAQVEISKAESDAAIVSLCAQLAKTYFQLRTYQQLRTVALRHIASQEKLLKITEARHEAGIGDMLEVSQAKVVLLSTRSTLPSLEANISALANSIAVLIGDYPANITPMLMKPGVLPTIKVVPDAGVPADLLRRRPDVIEAEAELALYAAQIGVAKKDFLPTIAINGSIGTSARKFDNLFGSQSMDYSISPTLSWTVFDGFARNLRVTEAKLNMEAAIDNYNLTVLNAVEEVDNALSQYRASLNQIEFYNDLIVESERELKLAVDRYKQGLTAYSNVTDAQMSYLQYQSSLVQTEGNMLANLVTLYEALGGGY